MGLFDGINNPFKSKDGLGSRISDKGPLSNLRWYDPLIIAGTAGAALPFGLAAIGGREFVEEALKDAELPESAIDKVKRPDMAPDPTDRALMEAAKGERNRIGGKRGRRSTFLTGQGADTTLGGGA